MKSQVVATEERRRAAQPNHYFYMPFAERAFSLALLALALLAFRPTSRSNASPAGFLSEDDPKEFSILRKVFS